MAGSRVDRQTETGRYIKSELVEFYIRRAGSKKQEIGNGDAMKGKTARSRISAFEFEQGDSDMNGGKRLGNRRREGEGRRGRARARARPGSRSPMWREGESNVAGGKFSFKKLTGSSQSSHNSQSSCLTYTY